VSAVRHSIALQRLACIQVLLGLPAQSAHLAHAGGGRSGWVSIMIAGHCSCVAYCSLSAHPCALASPLPPASGLQNRCTEWAKEGECENNKEYMEVGTPGLICAVMAWAAPCGR
jgi:hypothetical protein